MSYYFPPSGGPGVQRVLKFTRYLPAFGWRPVVLTVPETAAFPVLDPTLSREVPPEAKVIRSPIVEWYDWYYRLTGKKRGTSLDLDTVSNKRSTRERWMEWLRGALFIPDGRVGWLGGGTRAGFRACRDESVAVIFASGPPFTTHWIGARLAKRTGKPLVLDFRDPWTRAPFYPVRPRWAARLDERLERDCLRRASAVVTVNHTMRDDFLARDPKLRPERFHVIPNGFDAADFDGVERARPPLLTFTHAGSLHASRTPHSLFRVFRRWAEREPKLHERVRLRFLGRVDRGIESMLREPPFDRVATLEGYLPHAESVRALRESDVLLLLIVDDPQSRGMLTGKLFEYLGSGTPILALAPPGEAAELIERTRAGRVVLPDDEEGLARALEEVVAARAAGRRPFGDPDAAAIADYSRERLTARLAALFGTLAAGSETPPRHG